MKVYTKSKVIILLSSLMLFTSCDFNMIAILLTKNRVKIPDTVEGVWEDESDNPTLLLEIKKKDDYWASYINLAEGNKGASFTFHKFNNITFACLRYWDENGKETGMFTAIKSISDEKIVLLSIKAKNESDIDDLDRIPERFKEDIFISLLDEGKIVLDYDKEIILKKRYNLKKN